jgi:hypothetical protein
MSNDKPKINRALKVNAKRQEIKIRVEAERKEHYMNYCIENGLTLTDLITNSLDKKTGFKA